MMSMRWKVVALLLRARANMKVIIKNVYKTREKMKLYCRIFPSDYEFERNTLIQLWIAMEFSRQRCAEDFCERYFYILLEGQYIIKSRVDILTGKTLYKVDLSKFTALSDVLQTKDEDCLIEIADDEYSDGIKSWHISLVPKNIKQTTFERLKSYGDELRTLLFIRTVIHSPLKQIPSDMFLTLAFVQALDLSGICINELPRSIGNARQLRYLDLSFTLIESLPESIDCLRRLQTLKLEGCKHLYELPKGMKQLVCLRHLYFDVLGQLTSLPKGIVALTELRTLSAFIVDSEEGCSIRELKNMNNLSGSTCISGLENVSYVDVHEAALHDKQRLKHLQLRWNDLKFFNTQDQDDAKCIISTLKLSKELQELQIICYPGEELPSWVDLREHEKLVSITLLNCENNILNLHLGELPNLKYLNIIHMNRVAKLDGRFCGGDNEDYRAFPRLEKLVIDCMFSLETWVDVKDGDFGLLSTLIIKQCPKLTKIPFLSYLYSMKHLEISHCNLLESLPEGTLSTSLETLIIDESPLLKNRCLKDGDDWHKVKHVTNLWIDLEAIRAIHEDDYEMANLTGEASCSIHEDDNVDNKSTIDAHEIELHSYSTRASLGKLNTLEVTSRKEKKEMSRAGDWNCTTCSHMNFQRRDSCQRCGHQRPDCRDSGVDEFGSFGGRSGGVFVGPDVRSGDWFCSTGNCGAHNFASRSSCFKCGAYKKESGSASRGFPYGSRLGGGGSSNRKSSHWICTRPGCNEHNYASSTQCFRCRGPRDSGCNSAY